MYNVSQASSHDRSLTYSNFKRSDQEEEAEKARAIFMGSNMSYQQQQHPQSHNQPPNSGLLRFRSAPSSLLDNFTDDGDAIHKGANLCDDFESERFMGCGGFQDSAASCQIQLPPQYPRQSSSTSSSAMDGSYGVVNSNNMEAKQGSSLVRQSSSPAGLFSHLSPQNGTVLLYSPLITSLLDIFSDIFFNSYRFMFICLKSRCRLMIGSAVVSVDPRRTCMIEICH